MSSIDDVQSNDLIAANVGSVDRSVKVSTFAAFLETEFGMESLRKKAGPARELKHIASGEMQFSQQVFNTANTHPIIFSGGSGGFFDPLNPDRITIPAGVNLIKVSAEIYQDSYTASSPEQLFLIRRLTDKTEILARHFFNKWERYSGESFNLSLTSVIKSDILQLCAQTDISGYDITVGATPLHSYLHVDGFFQEPSSD